MSNCRQDLHRHQAGAGAGGQHQAIRTCHKHARCSWAQALCGPHSGHHLHQPCPGPVPGGPGQGWHQGPGQGGGRGKTEELEEFNLINRCRCTSSCVLC